MVLRLLFIASLVFLGCSDYSMPHDNLTDPRNISHPDNIAYKPFTDARDGKTYNSVEIGTQTWMAENLNYDAEGSKCYGNDENNCATYGRFYDWATAMALSASCNTSTCSLTSTRYKGICPDGWHLPSEDEWRTLMRYVSPNCDVISSCVNAGKLLKASNGWNSYYEKSGNGTDDYGFTALPGGDGSVQVSNVYFSGAGNEGNWWSTRQGSSDAYSSYAYYWYIKYQFDLAYNNNTNKKNMYNVRCVKGY
ncbi:hypothetical protein R83H12_03147 [Fibrobacteria bacterium R8-3-H12]